MFQKFPSCASLAGLVALAGTVLGACGAAHAAPDCLGVSSSECTLLWGACGADGSGDLLADCAAPATRRTIKPAPARAGTRASHATVEEVGRQPSTPLSSLTAIYQALREPGGACAGSECQTGVGGRDDHGCTQAAQCDDDDPCTADRCQASACVHRRREECGLALPIVVDPADPRYELAPPAGWTSFVYEGDGEWFWIDGKVVLLPASAAGLSKLEGWLVSPRLQVSDAPYTTVQLEILSDVSSSVSWQVLESVDGGLSWTPALPLGLASQGVRSFLLRAGERATSSVRQVAIRAWGAAEQDFGALTRIAVDDGRPPVWLPPAESEALSVGYVPKGWAAPATARAFDPEGQQVAFFTRQTPTWVLLDTYSLSTWGFSTRVRVHVPAGTTVDTPLGALVASDGVLRTVRPMQFVP